MTAARITLVMMPGAYFRPGDFAANGIVAELERRGLAIDPIESTLPSSAYLDGDVSLSLHGGTISPAVAPQTPLWLLGISLGALGALLYAQAELHPVAGMILIAPYLGSRGLVAEVTRAGGLAAWQPGEIATVDFERRMLAGLKSTLPQRLYLGYGTADRFAPASLLLQAELPPERVIASDGDHDWTTWQSLWSSLLDRAPFDAP